MHKEVEKYLRVKRKLIVLDYDRKKALKEEGEEGLAYKKPFVRASQGVYVV